MNIEKDYFLNCHTEQSIDIRYKSLAKQFHPDRCKLPDATAIFQEIGKQREKALRQVLRKAGRSDEYINDYLKSVFSKDKEGSEKAMEKLADEFLNQLDGKEPTFADALKFVFGGHNKAKGKLPDKGSDEQGKFLK